MSASVPIHPTARRHLARRDPVLKDVIATVGDCTLQPGGDPFSLLARAIVAQQISSKAAAAISGRLLKAVGPRKLTAAKILAAPDELLRGVGLSANKLRALRDLAEKAQSKAVPLAKLHELEDEEVVEKLVPVYGIGRWTAQMFLIFGLGRPDVLPVDDYGLRAAVQRHYTLAELPKREALTELAEPWRPYRSVATWYMWRSLGGVPQSDK
jgi:DNA-3-methyladenine glycosylase II